MVKSFEVDEPVLTALEGLALANPAITLIREDKIVFRNQEPSKIAIISGGGSGHEPIHAGFVGRGLLTGAVCGEVFASPSTKQILTGIKVLGNQTSQGILLIVKNYTGDVLHFGLAAERARALGYSVQVVIVGDDVAVGREKGGLVGRRAIAGTIFVHKTVGAYVEYYHNHSLDNAAKLGRTINENLVTIGASLDHAKVPGQPFESHLKNDEMELGMGIHNEPGVQVLSPVPNVHNLLKLHILPKLLDQNDKDRAFVKFNKDDKVVLLINNLGGVSNLILQAIIKIATDLLKSEYGIVPVRTYFGTLMTALDGEGFSVTLLNATNVDNALDLEFKSVVDLLDHETDAPAWPLKKYETDAPTFDKSVLKPDAENIVKAGIYDFEYFSKIIKAGVSRLVKAEPEITRLDTLVGDGDCGTTLVSGGEGLVENLNNIPKGSFTEALSKISDLLETYMGGTSGGLYSIFVSGLGHGINTSSDGPVDSKVLAEGLDHGLQTLYKYTRARPGDSTVIDALEPFVVEFKASQDFDKAVSAAEKGAKSTGSLEAKFGRASYVGESSNVPDPGAIGLVEFLKGVQSVF